jgi:hypothetical protein
MFSWMAGFGGTGLALMYLAVSVAGARGLWHQVNRVKLVTAATAGTLVSAGAVFGAFYQAPSPLDTVSWSLAIWLAAGVIWSLAVTRRRRVISATAEPAVLDDAIGDELRPA